MYIKRKEKGNKKAKEPRTVELQSLWIIGFKRLNAQRPPKAGGCGEVGRVCLREKEREKKKRMNSVETKGGGAITVDLLSTPFLELRQKNRNKHGDVISETTRVRFRVYQGSIDENVFGNAPLSPPTSSVNPPATCGNGFSRKYATLQKYFNLK
ncbi:hypothetical protein K0M31_003734 [Melipona bicolor]|uniref:Uncharacterized protein n=1 Tax=Melipona bicolor TaxID=60889 RepID=A0AA40KNW0_9HYME|nr:hypothetical protein K0M31_003734 [Melipona bicolor]